LHHSQRCKPRNQWKEKAEWCRLPVGSAERILVWVNGQPFGTPSGEPMDPYTVES
jgi:hypothetical protein